MTQGVPAVSDAVFRALTEFSPDRIVLVNQEGRIVLVNLQTEKLFGYGREELLGQAVETLVPERLRGRYRGHRVGFMGHRTDFAFLSKPFSLNTLARKIRTILEG